MQPFWRTLAAEGARVVALDVTDPTTPENGRMPVIRRFANREMPKRAGSRENPELSPPPKTSGGIRQAAMGRSIGRIAQ